MFLIYHSKSEAKTYEFVAYTKLAWYIYFTRLLFKIAWLCVENSRNCTTLKQNFPLKSILGLINAWKWYLEEFQCCMPQEEKLSLPCSAIVCIVFKNDLSWTPKQILLLERATCALFCRNDYYLSVLVVILIFYRSYSIGMDRKKPSWKVWNLAADQNENFQLKWNCLRYVIYAP